MRATKCDWIYDLVDETGFTQKDCGIFVNGFMRVIKDYLANGDSFYIKDFGTFSIKTRKDQVVPTGKGSEMRVMAPYSYVHFSPVPNLKEAMRNVQPNDV